MKSKEEKLAEKGLKILKIVEKQRESRESQAKKQEEKELQKEEEMILKGKELLERAGEIRDARKPNEAEKGRITLYKKEGVLKRLFSKKKIEKKMILINMELASGFLEHFLIEQDQGSFDYSKGTYIVDMSLAYWDLTAKFYALDYHEGFVLPLKRHIDVGKLNLAISGTGNYDCSTATNPSLIKNFQMSNIIEQVITSARLLKWLGPIRMMLIAILVIVSVIALILFFKLGGVKFA